jgi:formylglycine-generating enzyme required for sulfatase activity
MSLRVHRWLICGFVFVAGTTLASAQPPTSAIPGQTIKDCPDCGEMVVIPAGSFTIGSPASEPGRDADEGPQHTVTIRAFAAGKYEVTRGEYAAFVKDTNRPVAGNCFADPSGAGKWAETPSANWQNPGFAQSERDPVVCVSWEDAEAYAAWLTRKTGHAYRLLTEAEWEYAARTGTTTAFPWGDAENNHCADANAADQTLKKSFASWTVSTCEDGHVFTAPVGAHKPNRFGLYDMIGNVWELAEDCYHDSYNGAPADGSPWTTNCPDTRKLIRGGAWNGAPRSLRTANRGGRALTDRLNYVGFRIARSL